MVRNLTQSTNMVLSVHPDGEKHFSTLSLGVKHLVPVDSVPGRYVAQGTGIRACHLENGAGFRGPDLILGADNRGRT
jgi:hypothetical protein